MSNFDFSVEAELYSARSRAAKRQPVSYKRFDTAAEAVRFAMEDLDQNLLPGTSLEVNEERFDANGIRELYARDDYPLPRRNAVPS